MAVPIPPAVRALFDGPNYVHLTTLRQDGTPRNWVVWVGVEGEHILVCTGTGQWKAKDMQRDPRVALSVVDFDNPYKMAAAQGRVVDMRRDADNAVMDRIAYKYTGKPFPQKGEDRSASSSRWSAPARGHSTLNISRAPLTRSDTPR